MSQSMPYEAWRITYQSSEQAARAAYEAMVELQGRATAISEADRLELTCALGLLRGLKYNGSADALERVLRGAGSLAAVQQGVPAQAGPEIDERSAFDDFFRKRNQLHPDTDTTFRSDAAEPWKYWEARAALAATHPTQQGLEPLAKWGEGVGLLWDVEAFGKWLCRVVSPVNWDAHAVYLALVRANYSEGIDVRQVHAAAQAKQGEQANGAE